MNQPMIRVAAIDLTFVEAKDTPTRTVYYSFDRFRKRASCAALLKTLIAVYSSSKMQVPEEIS